MEHLDLSGAIGGRRERLLTSSKDAKVLSEMLPAISGSCVLSSEKALGALYNHLPVEEVKLRPASRLVFHTDPHGSASDRYRLMRMRFREMMAQWKLKTAMITSPLPSDGKSTTIANLATALAEHGKSRVLLIEADFYHPCLVDMMGIRPGSGLGEVLEHTVTATSCLRRLGGLGWFLLPVGKASGNPTELLQGDAFPRLLEELGASFDWILVDSPPVIPLVDALLLKKSAKATLLVTRAGHTPRKVVEKSLSLLGNDHLVGVVLNATDDVNRLYSKYSKYYGYYRPSEAVSR